MFPAFLHKTKQNSGPFYANRVISLQPFIVNCGDDQKACACAYDFRMMEADLYTWTHRVYTCGPGKSVSWRKHSTESWTALLFPDMRLQNISPSVNQSETFCCFWEKWSCETSEQRRQHQREPFWHWNELDPHLDPWCVFDPCVILNHITSGKSPYNLLSIQDKVHRSAPIWRRPACRWADRKFLTGDNKLQNVMWCCCLVHCVHDL